MASTPKINPNKKCKKQRRPPPTVVDNFDYEGAKKLFYEKLDEYLSSPPMKHKKWTSRSIQTVIGLIKEGKTLQAEGKPWSSVQCRLMQKYTVVTENGIDVLYANDEIKSYNLFRRIVPSEDYFDIILKAHRKVGHSGRYLTYNELRHKYVLHPMAIEYFLQCCNVCKEKKSFDVDDRRKTTCRQDQTDYFRAPIDNFNPSMFNETRQPSKFNHCAFMGFVDMRWKPDGLFNYLLYFIDKETKYILLRPLVCIENVDEILMELLNIFLDYGPPQTLYTPTTQISEQIESCLEKKWSAFNIKIVCLPGMFKGTSRHVLDMLHDWMSQNNYNNWGLGCRILQYQMNCDIKKGVSAYEVVFNLTTLKGQHDKDKSTNEQNQYTNEIKEKDSEDTYNSETTCEFTLTSTDLYTKDDEGVPQFGETSREPNLEANQDFDEDESNFEMLENLYSNPSEVKPIEQQAIGQTNDTGNFAPPFGIDLPKDYTSNPIEQPWSNEKHLELASLTLLRDENIVDMEIDNQDLDNPSWLELA